MNYTNPHLPFNGQMGICVGLGLELPQVNCRLPRMAAQNLMAMRALI